MLSEYWDKNGEQERLKKCKSENSYNQYIRHKSYI